MAIVKELIKNEADGTLSFGDYTLDAKAKVEDFNHDGDLYKVKTFATLTKLEKNGAFLYESEPGTSVNNMKLTGDGVAFLVEGKEDAQLTVGLSEDTEYEVFEGGNSIGVLKTNLSGKLSISVELNSGEPTEIEIKKH